MNGYLPSKLEHTQELTRQQVYQTVYVVIKHENSHLGEDKASRVANQYAVKATWHVYNLPRDYLNFADKFLTIISNKEL